MVKRLLILSLIGIATNLIGKESNQIESITCQGNETTINISSYKLSDAHMYFATQTDNKSREVLDIYYGQLFNWIEN